MQCNSIIPLAHISSLSQAASRVERSSAEFSQGATAAVSHSVETTVISELVVTSTLLLPGDAGPETLPDGLLAKTSIWLHFYPTHHLSFCSSI